MAVVTKEHRWFVLRAWEGEDIVSFEAEWAETGAGAEQFPRYVRMAEMVAELDARRARAENTLAQARGYVRGQLDASQMDRSVSLTLQRLHEILGG